MKKKYLLLSLLLIALLSISTALVSVDQSKRAVKNHIDPLLNVANFMEGDILGYSIHGSLVIEEKSNKEDMQLFMTEIVTQLGISQFDFENVYILDNDQHEYAAVDWYYEKNYYKAILSSNDHKLYISISVDLGKEVDVTQIYMDVERELIKIKEGLKVESSLLVNTAVYKELSGQLTQNDVIEQIYLGFKTIGAKLVSDYSNEGGSIGMIGYSPLLKNTVTINDKKHNLHIAVYYDETIQQYYVTIANPIIETSY